MPWKTLAPFAGSNELLRVGRLQDMYDNMTLAQSPPQVVSSANQNNIINRMNSVQFATSTFTNFSSDLVGNLYTSGRRVQILLPFSAVVASVTANVAIGEIGVVIDGVLDTSSIIRLYSTNNAAGFGVSSMFAYGYITPTLTADVHTFSLQGRVVGTSATLTVYYQAQQRLIVRDF